ncbi:MAG: methyltransferase domain-containing protein [Candidatus Aminicenantes bacterium]|nr:methyltransferase domain-containing protein [Candidatus Aminicenantes bacterium]MDH5466620.1 methyltransferase domain-containing protein [Candidatus Aminicenantes bacterium]MDH5704744.1 methyltransferase domain-containing protein [Candidatus Aminicenantes bacterium]
MTEKGRKSLFDDYFSSIFSHSNVFSEKEYENSLAQFELNYEKFLPSLKKAKILDVGCGAGHFLYYLEKKGFADFIGIDISPQQVGFCRENITQRVKEADVFEFLQGKENAFDAIVANDLLEHIPKEETVHFIKLVHAALRDKGIFLVRTPNMGNPFSVYPRYKDFTHEAGFTDRSLYQVFWTAGFRDIRILPYRNYSVGSLKRVLESRLARLTLLVITKLFQIQGFVAPQVLSSLLMGAARK